MPLLFTMAMFSGKTITQVSSVTYNIAGAVSERADFLRQTLTYLNAADERIGEKLPRMYLHSLGTRLKRAYRYAARIPQGLPTASIQLWEYRDFEEAVQALVDASDGAGRYVVEDAYFTSGDVAPSIEKYLQRTYGWDPVTRRMANPPAGFAQNAGLLWRYNSTGQSGTMPRTYTIEFRHLVTNATPDLVVEVSLEALTGTDKAVLVAFLSETVTGVRSDTTTTRAFQTGDTAGTSTTSTTATVGGKTTITTTETTITTDGTTTTVRTRISDTTRSERIPRHYNLGTGEWPTLDQLWSQRSLVEQTFFPSVPLRVDGRDLLADRLEDTETAIQIRRLCSLMGVDARLLRDQVNGNQNVSDIDYAFLVAGANMNTESQAEMDYLFRFWDMCRQRQTVTDEQHAAWLAQDPAVRPKPVTNTLEIADPQSKNGAYKVWIEWDYIKKETVAGLVTPTARVGDLTITNGATVEHQIGTGDSLWSLDSTVVSIRRQISTTHYEELQISGAVHKNDVYQGKVVETLARNARANPAEHEGFIVPLHMGIFDTMPLVQRTQFAQECLHMVFNCYVSMRQKWYQTSAFKVVLAIIGIIIIAASWGSATPAVTAAYTAMFGAFAMFMYVLANIAFSYLVSYLLGKWQGGFESVFGEKWAGVVMAVVAIALSSSSGSWSNTSFLQTAVRILDIASQLFAAYAKGVSIERLGEFNAFLDQAGEDKKLLDKLSSEFFGKDDLVSVDYLLQLQKTLREDSPAVFLSRTLMTGQDVVDMSLGMVSEMVSLQTTPRLPGIV